jgi:hypothetical protein
MNTQQTLSVRKHFTEGARAMLVGLAACLALTGGALAQDDPPTRVARLAYLEGAVSFQPAGTEEWVAPPINRPLTTGDTLWADRDGRAELQLDGSVVRTGPETSLSFLNLGDRVTQIELSSGTLIVHVRRLGDEETYEIDTPNLAFTVLQPGVYRLTVDSAQGTTTVDVRGGQGEVTGGGTAYSVFGGEHDVFAGTDELIETQPSNGGGDDRFDAWSSERDARWEHSASARYVAPDVVGYEDLDDQGSWQPTSYGYMWFPRGLQPGWAPYQQGHWAYVPPWGYTWVDDNAWGFAPFHYGRWASVNGAWGWVPAPPPVPGAVYVRPIYAPALVAWVGAGATIAWFALGPREVYVPSYPVSRDYVNRINVSNTTVSTTVINNVYINNTVINNKTVNETHITYANRSVPGAVTATTQQAFTSAAPVARNRVAVDAHALAAAPARAIAPPVVPTRQAVLGAGKVTTARPPAAVLARPIVARTAPPPAPPSYEQRQHAIESNAGRPLSAAQVRQIQPAPAAAQRAAVVRVAPPPHTLVTSKAAPAEKQAPAAGVPRSPQTEASRPAEATRPNQPAEAARPAQPAPPTHVNETPPPARAPAPSTASSVLERQNLQEQQQLHAQQEAERQRVERQQEADHQKLAQQQAAEAQHRQQEAALEQRHAQQTQELAARHAAEQQQLAQRQQQQRSEQQVKPAAPKPEPKPAAERDKPPR